MKKHLTTIVLIIMLIAGLSLLLYPTISDYWNSFHQTRAIASYEDQVNNIDEEQKQQMLKLAKEYNERLVGMVDRWKLSAEEYEYYESILDVTGTGIMGYVEIPNIKVQLPVYHGTNQEVLQIAVGHVETDN